MKPQVSISKELLAQIDLSNAINGGVVQVNAQGWKDEEGFHLVLQAPGIAMENLRIETVQQRFVVYHPVEVLNGSMQLPWYLVNLPLLPIVDVDRITARIEDGQLHVFAPFNDWAKGARKEISLEE